MDIGSNKATEEERKQCTHHLIDYIDPFKYDSINEEGGSYTAADFFQDCQAKMIELWERGVTPMLVGGTGFYLDWIVFGRPQAPASDPSVELLVKKEIENDSCWEESFDKLVQVDTEYAAKLQKGDYYRLIRALTVFKMTGKPLSFYKQTKAPFEKVDWSCFYITDDRLELYRRVDYRCELMIQRGLIEEVISLLQKGLSPTNMAAKSIGYNETIKLLSKLKEKLSRDGIVCDEEGVEIFKSFLSDFMAHSRQYVRRQETWFNKKPKFIWLSRSILNLSEIAVKMESSFNRDADLDELNHLSRKQKISDTLKKSMKCYVSQYRIYNGNNEIINELRKIELGWK